MRLRLSDLFANGIKEVLNEVAQCFESRPIDWIVVDEIERNNCRCHSRFPFFAATNRCPLNPNVSLITLQRTGGCNRLLSSKPVLQPSPTSTHQDFSRRLAVSHLRRLPCRARNYHFHREALDQSADSMLVQRHQSDLIPSPKYVRRILRTRTPNLNQITAA